MEGSVRVANKGDRDDRKTNCENGNTKIGPHPLFRVIAKECASY